MDDKDREQIALFRYGLIAPMLQGSMGDRASYLASISSRAYEVPYYGIMEYSPKTIEAWFRAYMKEGFDSLKPRQRSDKGKTRVISLDTRRKILDLRQEKTSVPVTAFYQQLIDKEIIKPQEVSYSSSPCAKWA
ncbi:MAG TPA: helix-turn-helix domain-containing protein [Firmicutes bacterium]|nr:helix-turn-helix domain-containing protein [Candidatus Fermentithermobacillaceae bacterium]